MLNNLRRRIARLIAPRAGRMYSAARPSRLTPGWGSQSSSEDTELAASLRALRDRSRALVRDAGYAKRAKVVVVNNVVGTGIGLQANVRSTRGEKFARINTAIEEAWSEWCRADSCHTGGTLHFVDLERLAMGQVFEAGEVFIRLHFSTFGRSTVPLALEVIEAERIADDHQAPTVAAGNEFRLGVELDKFGRPVAYWIRERHPNETFLQPGRTDRLTRVPASEIIHLRIIDRHPQTRAVPWMHATARKLNDVDGYTEAEIVAARGAANYMGVIESEADDFGEEQEDGSTQMELQPGLVERLRPGEKFDLVAPNRPNAAADAFIRLMLREVAAGIGLSYESLSRDYSQSNYSSSRLALLEDRDLWRVLQGWFIRSFRQRLHETWLMQAMLARAIPGISLDEYAANPRKFEAVRFKPRGWGWVDPTKEVEAYKEAVKAGFTTVGDVVAATAGGLDLEDVSNARKDELELFDELGLVFDTSPEAYEKPEPGTSAPPSTAPESAPDDEADSRVVSLRR